ncbi:MAG: flagellar basal body P-ring formation chaperone FlgA [Desulfobacterales bacterium]|nr:flagellar basal body P-ring formation chaperone FlgA [Desulfobacterales bacterium]
MRIAMGKGLSLAAAGLVVLLTAAAWGAGPTSVRVFDRAEIDGDQLLLGAIARVDGDDARQVHALREVILGRSPLPGKSRTLDEALIRMRLKQAGFDPAEIDLQVPGEVRISRGTVEVDRERIEAIASAWIGDRLRERGLERAQVREIRGAESLLLPRGRISWEISAPRHTPLAGSVPLAVIFKVDDEAERRVNLTAVVEARVQAVVSTRPLGRFKPIEAGDLELRELDLAGLPADYIADPELVIGKRTRRAVDANAVLRPDLVELPPVVKRGDRVRIVAETAGLRISAAGEVKQKGCVGERIPVVNLDSNRVIHALVVDAQTVRIEF